MYAELPCCFLLFLTAVSAVELTFELPDNAKECFHEVIEKGTSSTLEFQVDCFFLFILYRPL